MKDHKSSFKIVLTIHHFPPNYSAGAEIYTFRLANYLVQQGYIVEVVCVESITHEGGPELEYKHDIHEGISVWRLYFNLSQTPDPFRYSFENPLIGEWFSQFLQRVKPDLVHVNSCYLLSASTIAAAKALSLPLVITLHDFWFVCPRITLLKPTGTICTVPEDVTECVWCLGTEKRRYRWSETIWPGMAGSIAQLALNSTFGAKLLNIQPDANEIAYRRKLLLEALNQADVILSPSEFLRTTFIKQGIDPAKILYSRLGLDTSHWIAPTPGQEIERGPELRISFIGQLAYHKGVHLLLEAFRRLDFSKRQAKLKIYGSLEAFPDYVKSLRKIAKDNLLIEFAGRFDNRKIAQILSESDVIVVPSIWYENSPITIMEALTAGTPVITTNLGGMPELVRHEVNGLLFEVGDVADLTLQLQRLVDDPGLVNNLAAKAQPIRLIDDEIKQIISLYSELVMANTAVPVGL
jgi:glycosyltransferase involved in cell wall biosynthesis